MRQVDQVVRSFIINNFLFGQESAFNNETSFIDNGLIDSVGILTLVEFIAQQYEIEIADEEILPENWDSVSRICAFVEAKLGAAKGPESQLMKQVLV